MELTPQEKNLQEIQCRPIVTNLAIGICGEMIKKGLLDLNTFKTEYKGIFDTVMTEIHVPESCIMKVATFIEPNKKKV